MPFLVLTDAKVLIGGYNFSGYSNEISLQQTAELLSADTFDASGTKKHAPGLRDFKGSAKGFMDYTDIGAVAGVSVDSLLYNRIGATKEPFSLAPVGNTEGDRAYGSEYVNSQVLPISGKVGDLIPWEVNLNAVGTHLFAAQVVAVGSKSASGQTGLSGYLNFTGGVLLGERLFANLHVLSIGGTLPTLDVIVESSPDNTFASPTTRLTFTQVTTTVSAEHKSLAGPITDPYFRMKWTLGGTAPVYNIYGIIGVL